MHHVKIYDPAGGWITLRTDNTIERVLSVLENLKGTYAVVTAADGTVDEVGDVPAEAN